MATDTDTSTGDPGAADLYATVSEMTSILGINPGDAPWASATGGDDLTPVVDRLVSKLLEQRAEARAALALEPNSADSHTVLGIALHEKDWVRAQRAGAGAGDGRPGTRTMRS